MRKIFKKLGPGFITGAADDDPSGILTYLQSGVVIGFRAAWMALATLPLMYGVQEMCGRIGLVTKKGLMKIIKDNYSPRILYPIAVISIGVIVVNIGADLSAIGIILESISGYSRFLWLTLVTFLVIISTVFFSYHRLANTLKWLTLFLLFYVVGAFYMKIDWILALKATLIPKFDLNQENIFLLAAILGTTISPYLFFWQTNEEAEERTEEQKIGLLKRITPRVLGTIKKDTFIGMALSNTVMWFIIAGGSHLGSTSEVKSIENFSEAALVLQPFLGDFAYLVFSLGIIGAGLLTLPVLSGSVGYALAEIFNTAEGIEKKFRDAKIFYYAIITAMLAGMVITYVNINPVKLLLYTAALYIVITPPIIFIIMQTANNPKIMGGHVNSKFSNFLGYATLGTSTFAATTFVFYSLFF